MFPPSPSAEMENRARRELKAKREDWEDKTGNEEVGWDVRYSKPSKP